MRIADEANTQIWKIRRGPDSEFGPDTETGCAGKCADAGAVPRSRRPFIVRLTGAASGTTPGARARQPRGPETVEFACKVITQDITVEKRPIERYVLARRGDETPPYRIRRRTKNCEFLLPYARNYGIIRLYVVT